MFNIKAAFGVIIALLACFLQSAHVEASTQSTLPPSNDISVVTGRPFSAVKYSRLVRILPGGATRFLRNLAYPQKIGRDAQGRIHLDDIEPRPPCDQLALQVPPPCPSWNVFVFDPNVGSLTHWPEGAMGAHVAVFLKLTREQEAEAVADTFTMPDTSVYANSSEAISAKQDLGTSVIDGMLAKGTRIVTLKTSESTPHLLAIGTIHEVWVADEMRLILRVIDGDPSGIETISGIENVSLSPDANLFTPPAGYDLQRPTSAHSFAGNDMRVLRGWFVEQGLPSFDAP